MNYFIVDAFSDRCFAGNPAAICLVAEELTDAELQAIAAEFNLSETAFIQPLDSAGESWGLRWFTPTTEVRLCGHATLAAAHVLWRECEIDSDGLGFHTLSGELRVQRKEECYQLHFPRIATWLDDGLWAAGMAEGIVATAAAGEDLLVELISEQAVANFQPDLVRIAKLPARGLIVTAKAEDERDFVSRFFAPQSGIDEDPVTGSAHCALADYWATKLGKNRFQAAQLSARGGELEIEVVEQNVLLQGAAVTVMAGQLRYPLLVISQP